MAQPLHADPLRTLRAHRAGVLLVDGMPRTVRYVLDPRDSAPVLSTARDAADADDLTLCVPDDAADDAAQFAGALVTLDPEASAHAALVDRWMIYHGKPDVPAFFRLQVDGVKHAGVVFEADAALAPNAFAHDEARVCRELNADPHRVRRLCRAALDDAPERPLVVGIDPDGLDVRGQHRVFRVHFTHRADTLSQALEMIARLSES